MKSAIFVLMAALLAWALGGTLFPRAQISDFTASAVRYNGARWYWRILVGGKVPGEVRWQLIKENADGKPSVHSATPYVEVAGPVLGEDGLYVIGRDAQSSPKWELVRINAAGERQAWPMPDRLAAVQQLTRAEQGLPVQDRETIARQRHRVLDPLGESADE